MSQITSELLKKLAPATPEGLRDRFLEPMNEILPQYGIVTELQVSAFLATACFESMYFRRTKEQKCRPGTKGWDKYQVKYWFTNFMGRGIFQTTSERNYRTFGRKMKDKGLVDDSEIFVKRPELLEQPRWAVESACEFWVTNGLDVYARQGFKGFAALEGKVNRGDANKIALGEADRLIIYKAARLAMPDDFILTSSAAASPEAEPVATPSAEVEQTSVSESTGADNPSSDEQSPGISTETVKQALPQIQNARKILGGGAVSGFFAMISTKLAGMPDWMVLMIGVFIGICLTGIVVVTIQHRHQIGSIFNRMLEINADPALNNIEV